MNVGALGLELTVAATSENVPLLRHATRAYLEDLGIDEATLNDALLAVTEACSNVVRHAYQDTEGKMTLSGSAADNHVSLVVGDGGRGFTPRIDSPGLGIGIPLISALAESVEIRASAAGGTEVAMTFPRRAA